MGTKILRSFDENLWDLLNDAHRWEYSEINESKEANKAHKPKFHFTRFQWFMIVLSFIITLVCTKGINDGFAGNIISGMALFAGLLFTLAVALFEKCNNTNFEKYKKSNNEELYLLGVRLKNFYKKTVTLTLYTAIIAIACILLLAITLLSEPLQKEINFIEVFRNYSVYTWFFIGKCFALFAFRMTVFYFLLNFLYITKKLITSFYDYIIGEIDQIKLK